MAYGQFTGYEPAPMPGAYSFKTADGKSLLFGGPEAEQLKARLDASASLSPKVAGPGGGPVQPPPPATETIRMNPPEKTMALAQPPQDRPVVLNEINTGIKLDEQGRPYKVGGGAAGVSQEQLQTKATQGTALPSSVSESVVGGYEPDKEYLADRAISGDVERSALEQQRGAELVAEQEGRKVAQSQFVATTAERDEQQKLVNTVEQQVAQAQGLRQQALKDYTGQKVNPDRIFSGELGMVKRFTSAIAAAVGAYASVVGRSPNFAQQIIDNQIARDISAQEGEIRTKKDASDSALGDLMRRGMSLDQAKSTLGTIQRDWAKQQMILARSASQNEGINAKWDATIAGFDKKAMDEEQQYLRDAQGKATKAVASQVQYPVAARAGGRVYLTPEQAMDLSGKKTTTEGSAAGTAKTLTEVDKARGPGGGEAAKPLETSKSEKVAALSEGIAANVALTEELPQGDSNLDDPTTGPLDRLKDPEKRARLVELTNKAAKGAQASRGKSDKDAELAVQDVAGDGSLNSRKRLAKKNVEAQVNALTQEFAGMTPEQRAAQIQALPPVVRKYFEGGK